MIDLDIGTIIQGGGVGIAVLLSILRYFESKSYTESVNVYMADMNKTMMRVSEQWGRSNEHNANIVGVLSQNSQALQQSHTVIIKSIDTIDRMNRKMDANGYKSYNNDSDEQH